MNTNIWLTPSRLFLIYLSESRWVVAAVSRKTLYLGNPSASAGMLPSNHESAVPLIISLKLLQVFPSRGPIARRRVREAMVCGTYTHGTHSHTLYYIMYSVAGAKEKWYHWRRLRRNVGRGIPMKMLTPQMDLQSDTQIALTKPENSQHTQVGTMLFLFIEFNVKLF